MHPNIRPCRHLFTDGHQCGSPALRGEALCFNHHSARRPLRHQTLHGRTEVALPEPLDLHAIQRSLAELLRLTAARAIDLPLAAALHRQLSTASQNLARIDRADARAHALNPHRAPVTDYINHPILGTIAPEPAPQPEPQTGAPRPASETWESGSQLAPEPVQTPSDLQTQTQQNEDLETPLATPLATSSEAPEPDTQPPLPDPIHRFTLPPVLENIPSREALDAANLHHAQALETLAQGIHARAQTRAQLHAQLFPLVDDTAADQRLLDLHPQLQPILQHLQTQQRS